MSTASGARPPNPGLPGPTPPEGGSNLPPAAEACQNKAGCACADAGISPDECQFFRAPATEAFPLADFDQAQRVLEEIRGALSYTKALARTFPDASHIKVATDRLRQHLAVIITRLESAERGCMQLGLPI